MSASSSSRVDRWLAGLVLLTGLAALGVATLLRDHDKELGEVKPASKPEERAGTTIEIAPSVAEAYGLKTAPARKTSWQSATPVYGRVVPNPEASVEVRAPVAGVVQTGQEAWPGLGATVGAQQVVGLVQARFSPQERLDLQSKAIEAAEKAQGAEEVAKIQQERVRRLEQVGDTVARLELDLARVHLAEAKALRSGALAQAQLWKQSLAALEHRPTSVAVTAPLAGEIVEIGVHPGATVEAGAVLLKLTDFRRVLVRLDLPLGVQPPPAELALFLPGSDTGKSGASLHARRSGPAPGVDPTSQLAGYYFQATALAGDARWRPGLFVEAHLPNPDARSRAVVAVRAEAVLVHEGRTLVYVCRDATAGRYERRNVQVLGRDGDFVILGGGVQDDEAVVVQHPEILLSEQFRGEPDND